MRVSLTDLVSPDLARSAGIAGLGVDCGPYPAASSFGDSHVDANGATIRNPLTPAQNAQYLTAVATFQQCQGAQQGMPACPVGSHFSGGQDPVSGHWVGECINTYTGLPVSVSPIVAPTIYRTTPAGRASIATPDKYTDSQLISGSNSIKYTGPPDITDAQLQRVGAQIAAAEPTAINPGTVLAYMLGLGVVAPTAGQHAVGSDGRLYTGSGGIWVYNPTGAGGSGASSGSNNSGGDSSGNGDSQNSSGDKSSDSSTESNSNTTLLLAAAAAAAFFLFKP